MAGRFPTTAAAFLSPYHFVPAEEEAHIHALEQQLLLLPAAASTDGLPFSYVAEALDSQSRGSDNSKSKRVNLVTGLMSEALAHPTNPTLQVLALLRVLMPMRDSRSVYGFKTTSLIRSFARAIEKEGGVSGKAAAQELLQALKQPLPEERGPYLITTPEVVIARAHGRCFSSLARRQQQEGLSLVEVAALCQQLTNTYKERHKQAVLTLTTRMGGKAGMSVHIDSVAETLGTVLSRLSYVECKVLVRLLLRTVPMGIGPGTVMEALGPNLDGFLETQQDLGRLAMAIVKLHQEGEQQQQQLPTTIMPKRELVCGVPMTPMTCHTTSSPYLMKWLFTKQDTVKQYLSPKIGQLIIHSMGPWYVPTKSGGSTAMRKRFVDLESPEAIRTKQRRQHMLVLREIRRHTPALFRSDMARGYLISYMLYLEAQSGAYIMLLQGVQPLSYARVEFVDASVVLDDPKQGEEVGGVKKTRGATEDDEEEEEEAKNRGRGGRTKQAKRLEPKRIQEILKSMLSSTLQNKTSGAAAAAAAKNAVQTPKGMVRILTIFDENSTQDNKAGDNRSQAGMLVQRKMDGDRMQAHIMQDSKGGVVVKLFTKRGRPVHGLYTDVAKELKQVMMGTDQPCILDGEIVVVDPDTNKPLPWSSTKWRYDSSDNAAKTLSELTQSERRGIVTVVEGAEAYGYNTADEEDSLTFAPNASALMQWSDLGAAERERLKVKALPKGKLLFIVFDILMHRGMPLVSKSCRQRLEVLKAMPSLKRRNLLKHVTVIEESWYVKTAEELMGRLNYIVKEKGEGLILKNPDAQYEFSRSMHQRKLKLCGPDINCGVVGLGFTLSRNPRQWGLLTCIYSSASARHLLLVYNRVETLEGDRLKTAAEHILGLPSLVSLHDVLHNSSSEKPIRSGQYKVFCTRLRQEAKPTLFSVTWLAAGEERCTLYFLHGIPKDIQWLCNPFDCRFGLSQRGDIYPVDWQGDHDDPELTRMSTAPKLIIQVPRFPVGRIQLDDHQRSEFDTPLSIVEKFKEAADESTCLQRFHTRKIQHLRTKPPHPKKLEELRRILTAMENPQEVWPKVCPTTYYLREFSEMLKKHGYEELSGGERMVLSGVPKASQWDPLRIRDIPLLPVHTEEEEDMLSKYEANKARFVKRMQQLKQKMQRTILMTRNFARTGNNNFLDSVLMSSSAEQECFSVGDVSLCASPSGNASSTTTSVHGTSTLSNADSETDTMDSEEEEDEEDEDENIYDGADPLESFCMGEGEEEPNYYCHPAATSLANHTSHNNNSIPPPGYYYYAHDADEEQEEDGKAWGYETQYAPPSPHYTTGGEGDHMNSSFSHPEWSIMMDHAYPHGF